MLTKHEEGSLRILASCTDIDILGTASGESLGIPVLEGCNVKVIQGVACHKATAEDVKAKLAAALEGICTDEGYIADMKAAGYDLDFMNSADFTEYLPTSMNQFKTIVEEAGLLEQIGG